MNFARLILRQPLLTAFKDKTSNRLRLWNTDDFQWLTWESWFINLEQTPQNRGQQLLPPYKQLIDALKQN